MSHEVKRTLSGGPMVIAAATRVLRTLQLAGPVCTSYALSCTILGETDLLGVATVHTTVPLTCPQTAFLCYYFQKRLPICLPKDALQVCSQVRYVPRAHLHIFMVTALCPEGRRWALSQLVQVSASLNVHHMVLSSLQWTPAGLMSCNSSPLHLRSQPRRPVMSLFGGRSFASELQVIFTP